MDEIELTLVINKIFNILRKVCKENLVTNYLVKNFLEPAQYCTIIIAVVSVVIIIDCRRHR